MIVETCSDEVAIENDVLKRKIACLKWDNEKLKLEVDSLATSCKNLARVTKFKVKSCQNHHEVTAK